MTSKYTLQDAILYAKENGGECLTTGIDRVKSTTPITYKCNNGHIWMIEFRAILYGNWCKKCDYAKRKKYTIEYARSIALENGGECLSKEYKNAKDKLIWKCGVCHHEWSATLKSVKIGTWCPRCANKNRRVHFKSLRCPNCNKEVLTINDYYCSNKCKKEFEYKDYIEKWKNGEVDGSKGESISIHVKNYLFQTRGKKCEECGWNKINPFTGNIPITFHHVDGNWKNNKEENLKILCPNCHSLTMNYGSLNKGTVEEKRIHGRRNKRD